MLPRTYRVTQGAQTARSQSWQCQPSAGSSRWGTQQGWHVLRGWQGHEHPNDHLYWRPRLRWHCQHQGHSGIVTTEVTVAPSALGSLWHHRHQGHSGVVSVRVTVALSALGSRRHHWHWGHSATVSTGFTVPPSALRSWWHRQHRGHGGTINIGVAVTMRRHRRGASPRHPIPGRGGGGCTSHPCP